MSLEGKLVFHLECRAGEVHDVRLSSSRPLQMIRALQGKTVADAVTTLGLMYRVCGIAQRSAGLAAWRSVEPVEVDEQVLQAQQLLLKLESLREHLWQVLVIWPQLIGEQVEFGKELNFIAIVMNEMEKALFADVPGISADAKVILNVPRLTRVVERLQHLIEQLVCGMTTEQWLSITHPAQLCDWAAKQPVAPARYLQFILTSEWSALGSDRIETRVLPEEAEAAIEQVMALSDRDAFIARPTWRGLCCETNAYTRQLVHPLVVSVTTEWGNGLLARATARLVELVGLFDEIRHDVARLLVDESDAVTPEQVSQVSGDGMGVVEAARGRLMHRIKIAQGRVADYAILAPTEWNFHPEGIAVQGLKGLLFESEAQLRQQAALWINAIDPCVGYELKINGI